MNLKPDTILQRTKEIELRLDSFHRIEVIVNKKRKRISNHVLLILDVFAYPRSIKDALKSLETNGLQDWMEITSTIGKLYEIGALRTDSENQFIPDKNISSFGAAPIHIAMLNDKVRTERFINAINVVVKKGDVVVDIGTGTGVLAIAAARAGAKRVYAVEAGAMADIAQEVINNTEVADKITIIRGWSIQIELPERADVLVSEIIGNDPFGEKVLQTFKDAHQRLLKPGARILPGMMKVFGLPVNISEAMMRNRILKDNYLEDWKNWYNIDFSALHSIMKFTTESMFKFTTAKAKELEIAGEPLLLTETDFRTFEELSIDSLVNAEAKGPFNGMLVYFELDLENSVLTNHPQIAEESNSWLNPVWYFPEAAQLKAAERFSIQFKYGKGNASELFFIGPPA